MAQTQSQKILAAHCGRDQVRPGEIVEAQVDLAMANDVSAPLVIRAFQQAGGMQVFNPQRVVMVADHFTPNKDLAAAQTARQMAEFANQHGLGQRFEGGQAGVAHSLICQEGLALPGELIIGADSRACTYGALGALAVGVGSSDVAAALITGRAWFKVPQSIRVVLTGDLPPWVGAKDLGLELLRRLGPEGAHYQALEFSGPLVPRLDLEARQAIASLSVDTGAKAGLFPADQVCADYLEGRARRPWRGVEPDPQAQYSQVLEIDAGRLSPLVARPHSPHDVAPVSQAGREPVDQVFIGSCTGGLLGDLRVAAGILSGRRVHPRVRLMVIPATPRILLEALREGLVETLLAAGATLGPPSCGPCAGGHLGILAAGEVAVSTSNRNFVGRMGHPQSRVYLAGPAVAAASALAGRLSGPEEL